MSGPILASGQWSAAPDESHGITLYLEEITVSFDGFKALNDLTLYIRPGELRCIIGPNGAGKTTMMDVITGKTRPDQGSAWFGQSIDLLSLTEPEIAGVGIGRKFQKPTVFEHHSVFENLELAIAGDRAVWRLLVARLTLHPTPADRRGAGNHPTRRPPPRARRVAVARPEAVARDRDAAGSGPAPVAG